MQFFFLLLLSVPIFYVLGVVQLVRWIFGRNHDSGNSQSTVDYQKLLIADLEKAVKENPKKTIQELLKEYKKRYNQTEARTEILEENQEEIPQGKIQDSSFDTPINLKNPFAHWYSNNSINLLLYVGAFLLVLSASIFVGFQWGTISGATKATLLTLLAGAFFICGFIFYAMPKIKNAGYTFVAIGALVIPICSAAWYNFVLKDAGIEIGPVWLVTSLITISLYLLLALYFKSRFYSYIASVSTLSITLSIVNTFSLQTTYYILAGIASSFVLLLCSFLLKGRADKNQKILGIPFEISSYILMPISLLFGLLMAISQGKLFTLEASLSVCLAAGFYVLSNVEKRMLWKSILALFLFPLSILLFCNWQAYPLHTILSVLDFVGLAYLGLAYFLKDKNLSEEMDCSLVLSFILLAGVFFASWEIDASFQTLLFGFTGIIGGVYTTILKKHIQYISIATLFLGTSFYVLFTNILHLADSVDYLAMIYLVLAVGYYFLAVYTQKKNDFVATLGISSILYFCASLFFASNNTEFLLVVSITIVTITALASVQLKEKKFLIATILAGYFTLLQMLRLSSVMTIYYPLFFGGFSYVVYFFSLLFKDDEICYLFKRGGLIGSILTPVFFYFFSFITPDQNLSELQALLSGYGTVVLYGFETIVYKTKHFRYITSAIVLILYLWQIHFNGITEVLLYTAPIGIYFSALGYVQKIKHRQENFKTLTIVGLLFFLTPPFLLSFGDQMVTYSVILGVFAIAILGIGITINEKLYKYTGIAGLILAIIPQTYSYILLLPRWVAVGIIGLLFLTVAIYLLLRKKE